MLVWLLALANTVHLMPVTDYDVTTLSTSLTENGDDVTNSEADWPTTEPILDDLLTEVPAASTEISTAITDTLKTRVTSDNTSDQGELKLVPLASIASEIRMVAHQLRSPQVTRKSALKLPAESLPQFITDIKETVRAEVEDSGATKSFRTIINRQRVEQVENQETTTKDNFDDITNDETALSGRNSRQYGRRMGHSLFRNTLASARHRSAGFITPRKIEGSAPTTSIKNNYYKNRLTSESDAIDVPSRIHWNIRPNRARKPSKSLPVLTTEKWPRPTIPTSPTPKITTRKLISTSTQPSTTMKTSSSKSNTPELVYVTTETNYGTSEIEHGTPEFQHGSTEFQHGTPEFQHGSPEFQHGSPEFQHGTPEFQHGSPEFQHGSPEFQHGTPEFQHGSPEFQHGSPEFQHGTPEFQHGSPEFQYGSPEFQHGSPEVNHGTTESDHGTTETNTEEPVTNFKTKIEPTGKELIDWSIDDTPPQDLSEDPMKETADAHKYLVEDRTPNGYIVGEFGIVSRSSGNLRGVRYTAHGSINPELIKEALRTFLSL